MDRLERLITGHSTGLTASRNWQYTLAVLLLWAFFAQAVTSMVKKSPTVDEQVHLMRGYVYVKTGELPFQLGHPILANALNALPLLALNDLPLPDDDAARLALQDNQWGVYADRLIWQPGYNVERIFFLSRLPTVALGLLFAALVFRWTRQLWGSGGGIVALALFVFDPTLVAHSGLATDDMAVSLFYFAATYGLWRYLETRQRRHLALAGVAFGMAQGSKFSALLLAPVFVAVVGLWRLGAGARRDWRSGLRQDALALLVTFAIGGLTLWAGYRFELRPLSGWTLPVPATAYFEDLIWETHYFGREGYTFLAGGYSASGWWYYFLVAHALKSPLPALLLLGAALLSLRPGRANGLRLMALLLPACAYLLSTLVVSLNIGYRLFIPALSYLYVLTGHLATVVKGRQRLVLAGTLAWSALIALWIYPHYLAYFNALAGGPNGGYRYLVDSNIDWGQDLPALRDLVQEQNLGRIKLSYFGTAHPSYYGLDFEPLPTWPPTPEQGNPFTRTYAPHAPTPGVYAISASHLQGVVFKPEQWDTYAWFRDKTPFAKAGYSIFLYRVEASGPPVNVALGGLQIDELPPEIFQSFGSNDVRLRWFDPQTSSVWPERP
ncbi:MAG: glycosyltransferase family 39 protein, partial [Anaerolineae bacterium]